jgi:PAS domain S-box-containing protein
MANEALFSRLTRAAAVLCAAGSGLLAMAGLITWAGGQGLTFGEGRVPMAPGTALLISLFCIAAVLRAVARSSRAARIVELTCTLAGLIGAAMLLLLRGFGVAMPLEEWLTPTPEMLGTIPLGRMSPLTASCFVAVGLALLCERVSARRWQAMRSFGGWLALGVMAVAFIVVAAYLLGTPLLYGGATIPMALLTGLAFISLGGALLMGCGPDVWPLRMFLRERPAGHAVEWSLLVLFMVLTAGIVAVGFNYLRQRQAAAREAAHDELESIADLKVQQIVNWRKERLTDAGLIRATPYVARRALDALAQPNSGRTRSMFTGFLEPILGNESYEQLILLDADLNVRLVHPEGASRTLAEPARRAAEEALRTREVVIADLHRAPDKDEIHMDFVIPLVVRREGTNDNVPAAGLPALLTDRSAGALMLQLDAEGFLFPLIQRWPRPSRTAETLLVRREGNEVVYLNELRQRKGSALVLRRSLNETRLLEAMALRGEHAVMEGVDYRGVPVVAAVRAVPDTPWMMVAKVDQAELYARLRDEALGVVALVLVLVLAAILGVTVLWRRRNEHFLETQFAAEHARRLLAERFEHLMRHASDAILLADDQDQVVDVNERACVLYGYSPEEFQQLHLVQLRIPELREGFIRQAEAMREKGQDYFETQHLRKDGSSFPVEINSRLIEIGGKRYKLGIIRDITQRKMHEAEIERLNRLYVTLSQVNQTIVRCQTRDELLAEICRVAVEFGRFRTAWIGWKTGEGQPLSEVAHCVSGADPAVVMPGWRSGCGVVRETMQTGKPCLCTDARKDPRADCCREVLIELGVQSCAAFPLRLGGEICGVFSICSIEPGFFSEEEIGLLEEVTADISFALDKLDKEAQRQEIEDALRRSEAFTRLVLDNLPVGVAVNDLDPQVTFRYMNDNFPKFYRTTREALTTSGAFWEVVYEDPVFREKMRKRVLVDCASGDPERMHWADVPLTRRGQATTYITARNVLLPDKQMTISLVWDVTERKHAEETLATHLRELQRWHDATLGREGRMLELKRQVNELLRQTGQPVRYPSVEDPATPGKQ